MTSLVHGSTPRCIATNGTGIRKGLQCQRPIYCWQHTCNDGSCSQERPHTRHNIPVVEESKRQLYYLPPSQRNAKKMGRPYKLEPRRSRTSGAAIKDCQGSSRYSHVRWHDPLVTNGMEDYQPASYISQRGSQKFPCTKKTYTEFRAQRLGNDDKDSDNKGDHDKGIRQLSVHNGTGTILLSFGKLVINNRTCAGAQDDRTRPDTQDDRTCPDAQNNRDGPSVQNNRTRPDVQDGENSKGPRRNYFANFDERGDLPIGHTDDSTIEPVLHQSPTTTATELLYPDLSPWEVLFPSDGVSGSIGDMHGQRVSSAPRFVPANLPGSEAGSGADERRPIPVSSAYLQSSPAVNSIIENALHQSSAVAVTGTASTDNLYPDPYRRDLLFLCDGVSSCNGEIHGEGSSSAPSSVPAVILPSSSLTSRSFSSPPPTREKTLRRIVVSSEFDGSQQVERGSLREAGSAAGEGNPVLNSSAHLQSSPARNPIPVDPEQNRELSQPLEFSNVTPAQLSLIRQILQPSTQAQTPTVGDTSAILAREPTEAAAVNTGLRLDEPSSSQMVANWPTKSQQLRARGDTILFTPATRRQISVPAQRQSPQPAAPARERAANMELTVVWRGDQCDCTSDEMNRLYESYNFCKQSALRFLDVFKRRRGTWGPRVDMNVLDEVVRFIARLDAWRREGEEWRSARGYQCIRCASLAKGQLRAPYMLCQESVKRLAEIHRDSTKSGAAGDREVMKEIERIIDWLAEHRREYYVYTQV